MALEHDIQKQILLKLIHNPSMTFNELWGKEGESNKFAYHLKKMEEEGLVAKGEDKYGLTTEGKKLSAFIEGDTGEKAAFPTLTVVALVEKEGKLLCQKRLKEPFFGYWGFISGKINFGQNIFECATRDLLEEAGLHAKEWEMKALEQVKTYDEKGLLHHHYLFFVRTTEVSVEKTHKAENVWMTAEEYKKQSRFPNDGLFDHILPSKETLLMESERRMKDGKFTGGTVQSIMKM